LRDFGAERRVEVSPIEILHETA